MVYCFLVTTYPNPVNAIEYFVVDIIYGDRNEVRILANWRYRHGNDATLVAGGKPYDAAPGH